MGIYVHFTDEQKMRANQVDLADFLQRQGERLVRSGRDMRLKSDHSITVRGNEWFDHAAQSGGYAIDFVKRFYDLNFPEAVTMLLGGEQGEAYTPAAKKQMEPPKPFALPNAHSDMRRVYAYLIKSRFIERDVVSFFAKEKLLYESCEKAQDGTKEYHNAVFVGLDENGIPCHAHKRGLYTEGKGFKGNVDGSHPCYSFHYIGTSNRLYVFEAPIDMLSFLTLYPKGWQQHSFVCLCGVSEHSMLKALELHPHLDHVVLCLDHDPAGIEASEKYGDLLSQKGLQCGRALSKYKDWNEDIKAMHGLPALSAEEHPQCLLCDELCNQLFPEMKNVSATCSANELSALLIKCRNHLYSGRFSEAQEGLQKILCRSATSAAEEYWQINHSRDLGTVQARLCNGFKTYENRGNLKTRLDLLDKEITSLRGYERVLSSAEKEKLAECYEAVAAHCLKGAILLEQHQQKLDQRQTLAMVMS